MRIVEFGHGRETLSNEVRLADPLDPVRSWPRDAHPDAVGHRFLSRNREVRFRDGSTGALLATLVETAAPVSATFLADGRIVVGEADRAQIRLHVFSDEGTPVGETTIDRIPLMLTVGPEVAPGRVAVLSSARFGPSGTQVFDVDAGGVVETLPDMNPAHGFWRLKPPSRPAGAGVPTVHFFSRGGELVRLDFATGERRVVAGPGAPRGERLKGP